MKKTILICILLAVVCIVLVGCGKKEETIQENPTKETEDVKTLTIEFPSNPTTGYNWGYSIENENDIIKIDAEYIANESEEGMTGVGGKEVYTITGLKPGTTTVTFTYARSWEKTEEDKVAIYEFNVDENLKVTETHSGTYFEN